MSISENRYEWTGTTAQEALSILKAAESLINAHLTTLTPGDFMVRHSIKETATVPLTLRLDLSPLVARINETQALDTAITNCADTPSDLH